MEYRRRSQVLGLLVLQPSTRGCPYSLIISEIWESSRVVNVMQIRKKSPKSAGGGIVFRSCNEMQDGLG